MKQANANGCSEYGPSQPLMNLFDEDDQEVDDHNEDEDEESRYDDKLAVEYGLVNDLAQLNVA
jgi:hypothetical protein